MKNLNFAMIILRCYLGLFSIVTFSCNRTILDEEFSYSEEGDCPEDCPYIGFPNIKGNQCYINASLQGMCNAKEWTFEKVKNSWEAAKLKAKRYKGLLRFLEELKEVPIEKTREEITEKFRSKIEPLQLTKDKFSKLSALLEINTDNNELRGEITQLITDNSNRIKLSKAFMPFLQKFEVGDRDLREELYNFEKTFFKIKGGEWNFKRQHDAYEFIIFVNSILNIKGKINCKIIKTCRSCQYIFGRDEEPFFDIIIDLHETYKDIITKNINFDHLLGIFLGDKEQEESICDECGKKGCIFQNKMTNNPENLIVYTKRFSGYPNGKKIETPFINYEKIRIETSAGVQNYTLKAAIVQSGTLDGGHYIAIVKSQDVWWKCDDRRVRKIPDATIARNGYIFFYEKAIDEVTF